MESEETAYAVTLGDEVALVTVAPAPGDARKSDEF